MITDRDRELINFIYKYEFATIEHITTMFFSQQKYGYDVCRRRLKKISDNGDYIRSFKNLETNQLIYTSLESKVRKVSKHDILLMDYVCSLINLGCEIELLEKEKEFENIFIDALCVLRFNGYRYYQIIEVQLRHDYVDLDRIKEKEYEILMETNNVHPKIIIIQDTRKDYEKDNKTDCEVVVLDTKLKDIAKVLL